MIEMENRKDFNFYVDDSDVQKTFTKINEGLNHEQELKFRV